MEDWKIERGRHREGRREKKEEDGKKHGRETNERKRKVPEKGSRVTPDERAILQRVLQRKLQTAKEPGLCYMLRSAHD